MAPREVVLPGTRPTEHEGSTVDTNILRTSPEKVAPAPKETPHGCYDGWVSLGFEAEDEQGEHVEVIERVPCRRCRPENHRCAQGTRERGKRGARGSPEGGYR
jgi:hypothetical protein